MGIRATWKVLDRGNVAADAPLIPYECGCGRVAMLPAVGTPIAAISQDDGSPEAIIFDNDRDAQLPDKIQCRSCRRVFAREKRPTGVR